MCRDSVWERESTTSESWEYLFLIKPFQVALFWNDVKTIDVLVLIYI